MAPAKILERLDERFRMLTGGSRTAVARHQTLQAAVDWSYELLSDDESSVLDRLSVFAGGFTLDAAEAVASDDDIDAFDVLEHVGALVDKSLVVADPGEETYRLLETIRQYAAGRLAAAGLAQRARARHAAYYRAAAGELATAGRAERRGARSHHGRPRQPAPDARLVPRRPAAGCRRRRDLGAQRVLVVARPSPRDDRAARRDGGRARRRPSEPLPRARAARLDEGRCRIYRGARTRRAVGGRGRARGRGDAGPGDRQRSAPTTSPSAATRSGQSSRACLRPRLRARRAPTTWPCISGSSP